MNADTLREPVKGSCWDMPIALAWADQWVEDENEGRPDASGAPDLAKYIQGAINEALAAALAEARLEVWDGD